MEVFYMSKKIRYSEPGDYFPKEIRDKYFGVDENKTTVKSKKKIAKKGKK